MSKVRLYGDTSGFVDLKAPDVASNVTITLPNTAGPFATETYVDAAVAAIPEIAGIGSNVVETVKTDTFSTTSATFVTVTGLTATITPSSATAKVLIIAQVVIGEGKNDNDMGMVKVTRGGTDIYQGDAAGSRTRTVFGGYSRTPIADRINSHSVVYLDSPATTSATTYEVEMSSPTTAPVYINRSYDDTDNNRTARGASSITVIEVAV